MKKKGTCQPYPLERLSLNALLETFDVDRDIRILGQKALLSNGTTAILFLQFLQEFRGFFPGCVSCIFELFPDQLDHGFFVSNLVKN
jgi:hypothetical protein